MIFLPFNISNHIMLNKSRFVWSCTQKLIITRNVPVIVYQVPLPRNFAYQKPDNKKTFFDRLLDNIKQDQDKRKEIEESVKELHKGAEDAIKSDTVQKAVKKYYDVGSQATKSVAAMKQKMSDFFGQVQESDVAKQFEGISKDVSDKAKSAVDSVAKSGEKLSQSSAYKTVSKGVDNILEELDSKQKRGYQPPEKLRKRKEMSSKESEEKPIEADTSTQDIVLHKDSIWAQSWQKMRENNQMFDKLFDLKTKYDESDHLAIRASRVVTDRITGLFGNIFSQNEMSEVLTEIVKMDPTFTREKFIHECTFDVIPTILEAVTREELAVLHDWCFEAPYNIFAHSIKEWKTVGYRHVCKVLDLTNVDILMGKMMEQGPVLIISFQTQQIEAVIDRNGKVIEGDLDKVMRVSYVWALCRDQQELNPKAAWRLMEAGVHDKNEQWV